MPATVDPHETREVLIESEGPRLFGDLIVPSGASGIVIFADGSGSSRINPRNRRVAEQLRLGGRLGTLLLDLLTPEEELEEIRTQHHRFDIELLSERVKSATDWLLRRPEAMGIPLCYLGASTGAAAALVAAAQRPRAVAAVVSRGGRPDLAGEWLGHVRTPTLLLVGGDDIEVMRLNQQALQQMPGGTAKQLVSVPGASHLFEEPGALDLVARHAEEWFTVHLAPSVAPAIATGAASDAAPTRGSSS